MFKLPLPVYLYGLAQALGMAAAPLIIFVGGLIGARIAPDKSLVTLPIAAIVVGSALAAMPAGLLMQRFGRKPVFIGMTCVAMGAALLAAWCVAQGYFWGFCVATMCIGMHLAFIQQFRFAALEWVTVAQSGQAAAIVLMGGLLAAFIGPELGSRGMDLWLTPFAGSFLLLIAVYALLILLLSLMPSRPLQQNKGQGSGRSVLALLKQPVLPAAVASGACAYAVMSLIMTATPLSMTGFGGFDVPQTKVVIQSHIVAMFLPSLFAGVLISWLGIRGLMLLGLAAFCTSISIAMFGPAYWAYWMALILLGCGWNFLFLSGTALLPSAYHEEERFKVQALNDFLVFSVQAVAALMAGWLVNRYGWYVLNLVAIPLMLLALLLITRWLLAERRATQVS
jgi:MFS family permease